jgi:subtilisin family serine protease
LDLDAEVKHSYLSEVTAWIHELAADLPPRRILDLGSGTGTGAFALLERFERADAIAVDISAQLLHHLRAKPAFSAWPTQFLARMSGDYTRPHGLGTHTVGTAAGPKVPNVLPRTGSRMRRTFRWAKSLSNAGSGADGGILAGVNWAISNQCRLVSMSLGAPTQLGQTFSAVFEGVARRALAAGTLIVAAAGNESNRPTLVAPVDHPANCPSILAVGALDRSLQVSIFSCGRESDSAD